MFDPTVDPDSNSPSLHGSQDIENLNLPAAQGASIEVPELVTEADLSLADKIQLAEIYKDCFEGAPWNESWTLDEALAQVKSYLHADVDMIVLRQDGQVAGMVIGMPLSAYGSRKAVDASKLSSYAEGTSPYYLADFTVDATQQGAGLGSKLLESFVTLAERAGYDSIITRTRVDNIAALRVFTRHGFMSQGVYSAITGGIRSDRTVLSRKLP